MSVLKGIKKLAKAQTKRRKKMEAEKPLSARRDMAKKDVFTGEKYLPGGPKTMQRMTPEYRSFLNKQAKKETKKDKRKAMALAGATGATLAGGFMLGSEREKARLKKEKERVKKIQNKKTGGLVTKWENKWG